LDKDILYKFGNIHDLLKTPEHIQKNAQSYFKDFGKKQGFSDEEYIAGCIYAAYRLDGKQPVLLDDISIVTRLPDSSIMRAYKKIIDKLKLTPKPLPAPRVFVPMLLDRIGVNDTELRQKTYDLFDRLAKCGLESNVSNPKHFAAGVIYTADKIGDSYQTVKQYEAANASGTTHGVIRKVYNYLNEKLELGLWRLPGGAVIS